MSEKTRRVTTKVDVREVDSDDVSSASNESDIKEYVKNVIDTIDSPKALDEIKSYITYHEERACREKKENESIAKDEAELPNEGKLPILLHILNGILESINEKQISQITDFSISKTDIEGNDVSEYMEHDGYEHCFDNGFKKTQCYWSRKNKTDNYPLAFLKHCVKWGSNETCKLERVQRTKGRTYYSFYIVSRI